MKALMHKLSDLRQVCEPQEQELLEDLIRAAAAYVQAVAIHVAARNNFAGREPQEHRQTEQELGTARSRVHEGLISMVQIVNRLACSHGLEPIYTGPSHRYEIGAFALQLITELFDGR